MLIGVIADDFTGAGDVANTLAKGVPPESGLHTALYAGVPSAAADSDVEAGVVALKSRTGPVEDAVRNSLAALAWLRAQGCRQILFKYCSTFDSRPHGNIGAVADALAEALSAATVVFCPAFPATGRTVYQGHLFVHDRLLSESGMQDHPLTPMTDPDIRRFLGQQTQKSIGLLPLGTVRDGAESTKRFIDQLGQKGHRFIVADATTDDDLLVLGAAVCEAPLVTGGSGIAMGLPRNAIRAGLAPGEPPSARPVKGPGAAIAGSCSGATRRQIARHGVDHPVYEIDVAEVMAGNITQETLLDFIESHREATPLVYSSGAPGPVGDLQRKFGRDAVAQQLDGLFAATASGLMDRGYRRLVVAGGETSGAVASAVAAQLGVQAMQNSVEIDPGVPVLILRPEEPVALALKSGNFGGPDFFAKAFHRMEGGL
ncbi:MAG: 3-oxo-tetronate kinase [Pseudomonadota bacterium]